MQTIIYTDEEIQAGVASKMAILRAMRSNPREARLPFDERMALANDRAAFQRKRQDVAEIRGVPLALDIPRSLPSSGVAVANAAPISSGLSAEFTSGGDTGELTEAEVENANLLRLLKTNKRQASANWVVLDRASALNLLLAHPQGLTLAHLARQLLGEKATPRDTRRLSAMMVREEARKAVKRSGRGKPIKLTASGMLELQTTNVTAAVNKALDLQRERVAAQERRLHRKLAPGNLLL
jgi:hypothetical protein